MGGGGQGKSREQIWAAGIHAKAGPQLRALGAGMGTEGSCLLSPSLDSTLLTDREEKSREGSTGAVRCC